MLRKNDFDIWSLVHFFGSMFLVYIFNEQNHFHIFWSFISSITLGFIWEMLDSVYSNTYYFFDVKEHPILKYIFDVTGFSKDDLLLDILGSGLSVVIIIIFS